MKIRFMGQPENQQGGGRGNVAPGLDKMEGASLPGVSVTRSKNKDDGRVEVVFSEHDMEARADFFPSFGLGAPISDEYISALLAGLNIVHGVKWDVIKEAASRCNLNKRGVKNVLIACGDAPVDEVNEYFERNPHLAASNSPQNTEDQTYPRNARVDYREYSPFIIVKQYQALAKFHPRQVGQEGRNVHNAPVPYRSLKREGVVAGENTRREGKFLIAEISGQLVEVNNVMNVRDSLVINGAVGYATGNIMFPGDVIIKGPVSDRFKIYSGGSVTVKQTLDVTSLIAKGDLTVSGGVIGRGRGLVKVGGSLKARFIDNCQAACRKSIIVDKEIVNSKIFTMDALKMGDKGVIMGSEIYAVHGLRAGSIGKKSGKSSHIYCGVDFALQQEQEKSNDHLRMLAAKLEKLRELLNAPRVKGEDPEYRLKLEQLRLRLEGEREKISRRISQIMDSIISDEAAVIEVIGEIVPGTLVEICQIALFVIEPLRKVRIYLDKIQGKLICKSL